jgi:hypothetical protein
VEQYAEDYKEMKLKNNKLSMTESEWRKLGSDAGWIKEAQIYPTKFTPFESNPKGETAKLIEAIDYIRLAAFTHDEDGVRRGVMALNSECSRLFQKYAIDNPVIEKAISSIYDPVNSAVSVGLQPNTNIRFIDASLVSLREPMWMLGNLISQAATKEEPTPVKPIDTTTELPDKLLPL